MQEATHSFIRHLSSSYYVTATEMVSGDAMVSKTILPSWGYIHQWLIIFLIKKIITEWPHEEGNEQSDVTQLP